MDVPKWLAYAYAPIIPALQKLKLVRKGKRRPRPGDLLLPRGYVAEVLATDLTTPVHCPLSKRRCLLVSRKGATKLTPGRAS